MSRPLSSNVSTGISTQGSKPCFLLQVDHSGGTYYWSTMAFTDGSQVYDPARIHQSGLGKITQRIELVDGGNVEQITEWQFTLSNADEFHDTLATQLFDNRRAELRLIYPDIGGASWANAAPLFKGFITFGPDWSTGQCVFKCLRGWLNRYRDVPTKQMTKARYTDMPDSLEGKYFGLVYGDFWKGGTSNGVNRKAIAFSALSSSPYHHRSYIEGRMLKRINGALAAGWDACGILALAEHELAETYCDADIERIAKWDSSLNAFIGMDIDYGSAAGNNEYVGYDNPVGARTNSTNQRAGFDKNVIFAAASGREWIHIIPTFDVVLSSASGISDPTYCVDESPTNRTTISANNTDAVYVFESLESGSDLLWDSLKVYLERDGDETLDYTITDGTNTTSGTISTFGSVVSISLSGWTGNPLESPVRVTFNSNLVGGAFGNLYIKHLHIVLKRGSVVVGGADDDVLYQAVRGRMFHKYIDVAAHSNSYGAGNVIQNPAHLIESLLYEECKLTPAGLSYAVDFDGNDHLVVKHSDSLAITGDMSFFVWVYCDSTNSRAIIMKRGATTGIPAPFDYYLNGSGVPVIARGNGSAYQEVAASGSLATGVWHRIGFKISGTSVTHYLNGGTNGTGTMNPTVTDLGGDLQFSIPCRASNQFDGKMDEPCLLNYAVSSTWVTADYNGGNGQYHEEGETGLVGLWHFDEGYGREFRDWSGMGNDAGVWGASACPAWAVGKVSTAQQYNESSFDALGSATSALKAARHIVDRNNVRDLIKEICYEFGFAFFEQPDGLPALQKIVATADSVSTYTNAHFHTKQDRNQTPGFSVVRGAGKDIFTEFILHFEPNPATGESMSVAYVRNPSAAAFDSRFTNLASGGSTYWDTCHQAYVDYKSTRRWEYTAKWINDRATAEEVLKLFIALLTGKPYICSWRSSLKTLALQLLDEHKLTHDLLPSGVSGTARFRVTEQIIDPVEHTIDYISRQVA